MTLVVTAVAQAATVRTPVFKPGPGTYKTSVKVSLSTDTSGAVIRFTRNGAEPTSTSPLYTSAFTLTATTTVKARAFKTGMTPSPMSSATYTIVLEPPTFSPGSGSYVTSVKVSIQNPATGATLRYEASGKEPTTSSPVYNGPMTFTSGITLKAKAFKSGNTTSATATATYTIVAASPAFSPVSGTYIDSVKVSLKTATAGAAIRYETSGKEPTVNSPLYNGPLTFTSDTTLKAKAFKSGVATSPTVTAAYKIMKKVAKPAFSPGAGSYNPPLKVTIATGTAGAVIRYDPNGKEPTSSSPVYSAPLTFNASVTLKARAFKSGMADSDTASTSYTVIAPAVSSVKFIAIDSTLSGNPNAGGGQRMFAEARSANDTVNRRTVRVVAKVTGTTARVPVYFRVFDPDDPSDKTIKYKGRGGKEYTSDAKDLDKDANGNDNFADGSTTPAGGSLSASSATTDEKGEASVVLTVSRQPGNNFIVTASLDSAYSSGLRLRSGNGSVIEDSGGAALPTPRAVKSDMLTVWRTVHIEADRMGNVSGNIVTGKIKAVKTGSAAGTTEVTIPNLPAPGITGTAGLENRFENGRLRINSTIQRTVLSNTANLINDDVLIVSGTLDTTAVGQSFQLEDDDHNRYTDGSPLLNAATSRLAEFFRPAYVEVAFDLANPNTLATFKSNSDTSRFGNYASDYKYDSRRAASYDFWQVYILAAFQAYETDDGDHNKEDNVTGGIVDAIGTPGTGTHIFQETIRDFRAPEFETVVHEVGHLFGGEHEDLGMMAQSAHDAHSPTWTNVTLKKIRTIRKR